MDSILGTTWTIRIVTDNTPFLPGAKVEITSDARVKFDGNEYQGTNPSEKKVVVVNPTSDEEHWEFVISEEIGDSPEMHQIMYGFSRKKGMALPDPMGSWAADPQGH